VITVTARDGTEVAVHQLGGTGPPLVLAHATGFCGPVLGPLAAELSADFTCFALDLRGHGSSGLPRDLTFDWAGFALDVEAVVEGLRLERPVGFGHSCGGAALLLAEQGHRGLFEGLFCFEPVVLPPEPSQHEGHNSLAIAARRRREAFPSREAAYANFASKPPFASFDPRALGAYVEHGFCEAGEGGVRLSCRREHEAAMFEMSRHHDAFQHLGEVGCPVTVACGSESTTMGPPTCASIASRLPLGRLEVLPGMGHLAPLEHPAVVADSVARALRGTGRTG
jgi:pimeloyl-ACP methyl ester carboxylesterase